MLCMRIHDIFSEISPTWCGRNKWYWLKLSIFKIHQWFWHAWIILKCVLFSHSRSIRVISLCIYAQFAQRYGARSTLTGSEVIFEAGLFFLDFRTSPRSIVALHYPILCNDINGYIPYTSFQKHMTKFLILTCRRPDYRICMDYPKWCLWSLFRFCTAWFSVVYLSRIKNLTSVHAMLYMI